MARWTPRGADPAMHEVLVDGVPPWMYSDVQAWLEDAEMLIDLEHLVRGFDRDTRRFHVLAPHADYGIRGLLEELTDHKDLLDFIEYFLYYLEAAGAPNLAAFAERLDVTLAINGSKWQLGRRGDFLGLVDRVPAGVAMAAHAVTNSGTTAGDLLAEAWVACFGRSPDYEEAYEKAIKAVEEAGAEKVLPRNPKATLGTMAQALEDQGDWRLPLGEDPKHPTGAAPAAMARALWVGQESRHGGNGYRKPTREEAESAVMLAVPLVQWFTSGVLVRRS